LNKYDIDKPQNTPLYGLKMTAQSRATPLGMSSQYLMTVGMPYIIYGFTYGSLCFFEQDIYSEFTHANPPVEYRDMILEEHILYTAYSFKAFTLLSLDAADGYGDGFLEMVEHVGHLMADHRTEQQHYLTQWAADFEGRIGEAIQRRLQETVCMPSSD
jgi:hypothetical protein